MTRAASKQRGAGPSGGGAHRAGLGAQDPVPGAL